MYKKNFPQKRYKHTLDFVNQVLTREDNILDLGVKNPFSEILSSEGYKVTNTTGEDLDLDTSVVQSEEYSVVTAFEILEHLVSPYPLLRDITANKLVVSIPLRLWFSSAYKSKTDPWDRHFHEFEDWQFDWLLEKSGWIIKRRMKFTNPVKKIGIRPLFRLFTPRYYLLYAERAV